MESRYRQLTPNRFHHLSGSQRPAGHIVGTWVIGTEAHLVKFSPVSNELAPRSLPCLCVRVCGLNFRQKKNRKEIDWRRTKLRVLGDFLMTPCCGAHNDIQDFYFCVCIFYMWSFIFQKLSDLTCHPCLLRCSCKLYLAISRGIRKEVGVDECLPLRFYQLCGTKTSSQSCPMCRSFASHKLKFLTKICVAKFIQHCNVQINSDSHLSVNL